MTLSYTANLELVRAITYKWALNNYQIAVITRYISTGSVITRYDITYNALYFCVIFYYGTHMLKLYVYWFSV